MYKTAIIAVLLIAVLELVGLAQASSDDDFILCPVKTNLVPDFSTTKKDRTPVLGFGVNGELTRIKVEEHDLREAEERLRRYDRNGDQVLDADELKLGRWSGSPIQFDRDQDGRLSLQELALRYAQRRVLIVPDSTQRDNKALSAFPKRDKNIERKVKETPGPFESRSSYRFFDKDGVMRPTGLPDWFINLDVNRDNQVSMKETGWQWNQDTLICFNLFDINRDGFITSKECVTATNAGYSFGAMDRTP